MGSMVVVSARTMSTSIRKRAHATPIALRRKETFARRNLRRAALTTSSPTRKVTSHVDPATNGKRATRTRGNRSKGKVRRWKILVPPRSSGPASIRPISTGPIRRGKQAHRANKSKPLHDGVAVVGGGADGGLQQNWTGQAKAI